MSKLTDYTNKDYEAFRSMMIDELQKKIPEYTDTSQTDAGIVMLELLAKGLDVLSYYQDVNANETYLTTCEQRESALKWCSLLGYTPNEATPAKCLQIFRKSNKSESLTIYKGTKVSTSDGIIFETVKDLYIPKDQVGDEVSETGEYLYAVPVVQGYTVGKYDEGVLSATEYVATGDGTENQTYTLSYSPALIKGITLDDGEVFGELRVFVNGLEWSRVDSFIHSTEVSKHFTATINGNDQIVITFGSLLLGELPFGDIYVTYRVGGGTRGNVVGNSLTTLVENLPNVQETTNVTAPSGYNLGYDKEDLDSIRINAPANFRTLDRAVTLQDHTDLILLNRDFDVIKSAITYNSTNTEDPNYKDTVQIYIQLNNGEDETQEILDKVKDFITSKQIIGTFAEVYYASKENISLEAVLVVEDNYNEFSVKRNIKDTTYNYLSHKSFNVAQDFEIVEFENLINDLDGVKYFRVTSPTSMVTTPSRGKYLELDSSEDESENNPNFKITLIKE